MSVPMLMWVAVVAVVCCREFWGLRDGWVTPGWAAGAMNGRLMMTCSCSGGLILQWGWLCL